MALRIRIDPIEKVTEAVIRKDLLLPEQRKAAADFARVGLEDAKQINQSILGRVPPYTVTVDGRQGASLESVNPDGGSIIVEFDIVSDVLAWIGQTLVERSPVVSGKYKHSHMLFADGQEIALGAAIPQAEEYVFLNLEPYSRKLEIGKTESGRDFLISVPNRIYERTAKDAKSRFGNIADITFAYRQIDKGYTLKRSHGRGAGREASSALMSPAILVKYRKS